jgi:hypothetical protein
MPLPLAVPPTVTVLDPRHSLFFARVRGQNGLGEASLAQLAGRGPYPGRDPTHRQTNPDDASRSHGHLARTYTQRLRSKLLHRARVLDAPLPRRRVGDAAVRHDRPYATALHSLPRHDERRPLERVAGKHGRRLARQLGEEKPQVLPPDTPHPAPNSGSHEANRRRYAAGTRLYSDC